MNSVSLKIPMLICLTFLSVLAFEIPLAGQTSRTPIAYLSPGDNIQSAVDAAPKGTTFVLRAGIYRMQSVAPKDGDIFSGEGNVILNGSQVLSFRLDPAGSGLWVSNATAMTWVHGKCLPDHPLCGYSQDLFIDGAPQNPVANPQELRPDSWYFDRANNKVYVPSDPSGRLVELGMKLYAFYGSASGVRLDHLTVEKYAAPAQSGAIGGNRAEGTGWLVNHVEVRWNHGVGIVLGSGSQISDSFIHHNGELGITFHGTDCQAVNNEISWNNFAGFHPGWESGGSKSTSTTNLVLRSNNVHDNRGPGLWTDFNNVNTLYENNTVVNNMCIGIQHEISYHAIIRNNIVKGNGNLPTVWLWNAQILIQNSSNVEVYGNTVEVPAAGGNGIAVIDQKRGSGTLGPWVAANNFVHDNTITYLGIRGASGIVDDPKGDTPVGNRFDSNRYILKHGGEKHWSWFQGMTWQGMLAAGQEAHGSCCK
jgi:hypothetical protein